MLGVVEFVEGTFRYRLLPMLQCLHSVSQDVQEGCRALIPGDVLEARKVFEIVSLHRVDDIDFGRYDRRLGGKRVSTG